MALVAVTGSTGQLGRIVINKLKERIPANEIIALARTPAKASDLGVQVRAFDYERVSVMRSALSGVETLLLISSSEVGRRVAQHENAIDAASKSGVKWIIYTSLLHADTSAITALAEEHLATEALLKNSGIQITLLRNGWYTENYAASIPGAIASGALIGCAGNGKISSAARVDYADAAVSVLTSERHQGKTYELAGDQSFTLSELAAEISQQTGKKIPYKNLSEAGYALALSSFGLPKSVAEAYASYDTAASKGALFDDGHQLSQLIGRATTSLASVVSQALRS